MAKRTDKLGPIGVEEFERMPEDPDGWREELVRGYIVREPPPAPYHGSLQARLAYLLETNRRVASLEGIVAVHVAVRTSLELKTVLGPDVVWARAGRIPPDLFDVASWRDAAPELAVEILSPSERRGRIRQKVSDYLNAGVRQVWVVDPRERTLTVHRSADDVTVLSEHDELDAGDVLPGFRLSLQELFQI